MVARADLHVHSKHSNRPSEWILRQFGAPESFTESKEIYRLCRERGMSFVTISDHDTIDGALEILHLPGTFASCEVTVEFPEDGCEIHCLVTGIDEAQHREIQALRRNVYELRDYLVAHGIVHSVAHPLFRVNDRLTLAQVEKLLVLFNRFEALNGIHDRRANDLVRKIFGGLTPEVIEDLAERHRLSPTGAAPWRKFFTGGSDDHGGFYIATTYTETPAAATVEGYLAHLAAGDHQPGGETGSSLRLAQSLYGIAHEFYRRQFPLGLGSRKDPFSELLRSLATPPATPPAAPSAAPASRGLRGRLWSFAGRRKAMDRTAAEERAARGETVDRATFGAASEASQELLGKLFAGFFRNARRGRLMESLAAAAAQLAPLGLSIAPYLVSLHAQHKDADLLEQAALRFLGRRPEEVFHTGEPARQAWFTDGPMACDGAAKTVRSLAGMAEESGRRLVAITCGRTAPSFDLTVRSFPPMAELPVPGDRSRKIALPPLLEILEHCERERYAEILVGTPGPLGLLGLLAGKLLGIPTIGVYASDFPLHVRQLLGGPALDGETWAYMRWFYGRMDRLYVASRGLRESLAAHGFEAGRMALLPDGVDISFSTAEARGAVERSERDDERGGWIAARAS